MSQSRKVVRNIQAPLRIEMVRVGVFLSKSNPTTGKRGMSCGDYEENALPQEEVRMVEALPYRVPITFRGGVNRLEELQG